MRTLTSITLVASALTFTSCRGSATLRDSMFDHFSRAGQIQTALIVGDLEGARRPALWLAEYDGLSTTVDRTEGWVDQLRSVAREVADAPSIDQAADATGRLAATCAGCHVSTDGGPTFRPWGEPPVGRTRSEHMTRHLWAMDRMWEGLIGASSETWRQGAQAIADEEPDRGFPGGTASAALAETMREQATRALYATESERPTSYAELVKVCAACHGLVGVGSGSR